MYGFERKHIIRLSLIFIVVTLVVGLAVLFRTQPSRQLGNVFGMVETAFTTSQKVYGLTRATVKLDSGAKVVVDLPSGMPFVPGARVELSVHETGSEPMRYYTYKFVGYRGEQPTSE